MKKPTTRFLVVSIALFLLAMAFFWLRPIGIIHWTVMAFYKNPLVWKAPLLLGLLAFLAFAVPQTVKVLRAGKKEEPAPDAEEKDPYYYSPRRARGKDRLWPKYLPLVRRNSYGESKPSRGLTAALIVMPLAFVLALIVQGPLNSRATYEHYSFSQIAELPETKSARIMPFEVAEQISSSGFDSSTERLAQLHVVLDAEGRMLWTYGQVPDGIIRRWSKKTQGMVSQPADITSRELTVTEQEMRVSPDVSLTDSVTWQAYKENFFSEIAATTFMLDDQGEPVIVAPYIEYEGFWTKVPVLGGVLLVRPDGEIKDLSPEQAATLPFLARSGQLVPASLARTVQESYKYKGGILNRFFVHDDQTELPSTGASNQQPYLTSFRGMAPQWVSSAEPYGRSYATKAVFLTDSVSGQTRVWSPAENSSLSGPAKALDVVKGLAIPGILFSKFRAIEPRPIVHDGRLQFVVSVVPNTFNTVTKTVIVDAASNKAVATFNHDTDPGADKALREYIAGKDVVTTAAEIKETGETDSSIPSLPAEPAGQKQLIENLIESNQKQRELLEELRRQLASP